MVALAIGMAVVGALIAAYLASFASGRHSDALVQITEDATLALNVMRQQVAQAGFSQPHGVGEGGGLVLHAFPAVAGCKAANFVDLQASIAAPSNCASADPDRGHARFAGGRVRRQRAAGQRLERHPRRHGQQPAAARLPRQLVRQDARRRHRRRLLAQRQQVLRRRRQPLLPRPGQRRRRGAGAERRDAAGHLRHGRGARRRAGRRPDHLLRRRAAPGLAAVGQRGVGQAVRAGAQRRQGARQGRRAHAGQLDRLRQRAAHASTDGYMRRTFTTTIVLQNKLL